MLPEKQAEYEDFESELIQSHDKLLRGEITEEEREAMFSHNPLFNARGNTQDAPSLVGFPYWDIVPTKESKMYLCDLEPPSSAQIAKFRAKAKIYLDKICPRSINLPEEEMALKIGTSWYKDGPTQKRDFEKPEYSYSGSLRYQKFMTGPATVREVWLPPKAYKLSSTWWHLLLTEIIKSQKDIAVNEDILEIFKDVSKRWKPNRSIDLKGCGLQYPREYLLVIMEEIARIYNIEEIYEQKTIAENLFSTLSVEMDANKYVYPKRGVGLGYFAHLMTVASRIILDDCYVIKMFSDDILVRDQDYEKACSYFEEFGMVLNEKKCGIYSKEETIFAGHVMNRRAQYPGNLSNYQGPMAAMFTKRYHWERKQIATLLDSEQQRYVAYHYERIFGYEFFRGESMLHPDNGGIYVAAPVIGGTTDLQCMKHFKSPYQETMEDIVFGMPFYNNQMGLQTAREFHNLRKRVWKDRVVISTWMDEAVHPETTSNLTEQYLKSKLALKAPSWSEDQLMAYHGQHFGLKTCGLSGEDILHALYQNKYSRNPYHDYVTGGSEVTSLFYIDKPLDSERLEEAELYAQAQNISGYVIYRQDYYDTFHYSEDADTKQLCQQIDEDELDFLFGPSVSTPAPNIEEEFAIEFFNDLANDDPDLEEDPEPYVETDFDLDYLVGE